MNPTLSFPCRYSQTHIRTAIKNCGTTLWRGRDLTPSCTQPFPVASNRGKKFFTRTCNFYVRHMISGTTEQSVVAPSDTTFIVNINSVHSLHKQAREFSTFLTPSTVPINTIVLPNWLNTMWSSQSKTNTTWKIILMNMYSNKLMKTRGTRYPEPNWSVLKWGFSRR